LSYCHFWLEEVCLQQFVYTCYLGFCRLMRILGVSVPIDISKENWPNSESIICQSNAFMSAMSDDGYLVKFKSKYCSERAVNLFD